MHLVVRDPAALGRLLAATPGVAHYTFRANAFSLAASPTRTYGTLVIGIDPEREAHVSTLRALLRQGDYLSEREPDQALLGELLAKNLGVNPGDEVVLLGQGRDGSIAATVVKVRGIYSSGQDDFDRASMHIPLTHFQEVYAMRGAVHEAVVLCESLDRVPDVKNALIRALRETAGKDPLVVLDWKEIMPGLIQAIQMDLVSGFIFYVILLIVVAFSILNTFLMAIFERTREFGVMMALGTAAGRLTRLLLMESMVMVTIGTLIGAVLGGLLTGYFQSHGILMSGTEELLSQYGMPGRMYPKLSLLSVAIGMGSVLVITFLTALYPALKVRALRPVQAMKAI
jgi:ABC-type lipoprotein release transport system permease subunit